MPRLACSFVAVLASMVVSPVTVRGQQVDPASPPATPIANGVTQAAETPPSVAPEKPRRPAALVPLYSGLIGVQILDYLSTTRAVAEGAGREGNPLVSPFVENRAAFAALKAGSTAGAVWAAEKMWKRNRVGAVVLMAALDGAMVAVVAHNYSVARTRR